MKKLMDNLSSEVLIYIQNLKTYFKNNQKVKNYFILNDMDEYFYDEVIKISTENFINTGQPMLSVEQFESVRNSILKNKKISEGNLFVDYLEFGKFYLN